MIAADFPGIKSEDRDKIFGHLMEENWKKVEEVKQNIPTVWYKPFEDDVSYGMAVEMSKKDFIRCSKLFTMPRLVIHVGPKQPLVY